MFKDELFRIKSIRVFSIDHIGGFHQFIKLPVISVMETLTPEQM